MLPVESVAGVEFDFGGGRVYTIPPLSLGGLQALQGQLGELYNTSALEPATGAIVVKATHTALRRNYPDITLEDVAELVDLGNMYDVISCVLDVAGLRRKTEVEEKKQQAQLREQTPSTGPL